VHTTQQTIAVLLVQSQPGQRKRSEAEAAVAAQLQ